MSFSFNGIPSGNVNVIGGVNTVPLTLAKATRGSNGTTAIYTVPAAKKAYVYFAELPVIGINNMSSYIRANAFEIHSKGSTTVTNVPMCSANGILLTTGQVVDLTVTNWSAGTEIAVIGYYEVDA